MIKIQCPCGETYTSDNQHIGKHIQCNKCKSILAIHENVSPVPALAKESETGASPIFSSPPLKPSTSSREQNFRAPVLVIVALIVIAFLYYLLSSPSSHRQEGKVPIQASQSNVGDMTKDAKQADISVEPKHPKRLPLGASPFGTGIHGGKSKLSLNNGTDTDALVGVLRLGKTEELIRNSFIPAGKKYTTKQLPPGTYILRIAFGSDWDDEKSEFNFRQSFSQSEEFQITENTWTEDTDDGYIKHTKASGMSVTLHKVINGNFKTHTISEDKFWASFRENKAINGKTNR